MTNVKPEELNYDSYSVDKYEQGIINAIPFHKEIHQEITNFIKEKLNSGRNYAILELGVGTGLTTRIFYNLLSNAEFDVVDFSKQMLEGARNKLGVERINYLFGDYSEMEFTKKYDIVISVIGVHHQTNEGKKKLFNKIYSMLKPRGIFIFADLVTYKDKYEAAFNNALHYHYLVEHTTDDKTLMEWAHHHMFLNELAPIEDQIEWLQEAGFNAQKKFLKMNTALLICKK